MIIQETYTANPGAGTVSTYNWSVDCSGITIASGQNQQTVVVDIDTEQVVSGACTLACLITYADGCVESPTFSVVFATSPVLSPGFAQIICGSTAVQEFSMAALATNFTFQPGSISISTPASEGTTVATATTIQYTPLAIPTVASVTITYKVTDLSTGNTVTGYITVLLNPCVLVPVSVADVAFVNCNSTVLMNIRLNDPVVPDAVITVIKTHPNFGTAVVSPDGQIQYTPNPDYDGPDSLEYCLHNPAGPVDGNTVTVTITVNPCPSCDEPTISAPWVVFDGINYISTFLTTNVLATDLFNINTQNTVLLTPGDWTFDEPTQTLTVTYAPEPGPVTIIYVAIENACETATVQSTHTIGQQAPVAVNDSYVGVRETALLMDVDLNDYDPNGLAIIVREINGAKVNPGDIESIPEGDLILLATGEIQLIPAVGYIGTFSFDYRIRNYNSVLSNLANVLVTINENCNYVVNILSASQVCDYTLALANPDTDVADEMKVLSPAADDTIVQFQVKKKVTSTCVALLEQTLTETLYESVRNQLSIVLAVNGYIDNYRIYQTSTGTNIDLDISLTSPHLGGVPPGDLQLPADYATNAGARANMENAILQVLTNAMTANSIPANEYSFDVIVTSGGSVAINMLCKHAPTGNWAGVKLTDGLMVYNPDGVSPLLNTSTVSRVILAGSPWDIEHEVPCKTMNYLIDTVSVANLIAAATDYNAIVLTALTEAFTIDAGGSDLAASCTELTLTANPLPFPAGPTYLWEFDEGSTGTFLPVGSTIAITVDGLTLGIYRCTVTASGCVNQGHYTVI